MYTQWEMPLQNLNYLIASQEAVMIDRCHIRSGSRMTLEVCQMSDRKAVSRQIWSLFWFLYFIYKAPSSCQAHLVLVSSYILLLVERVTMHKGPQKCSCNVNCWIAKLRVLLNYCSILFLTWISFLGRRLFCKDFSISGAPFEWRNWSYSHWIQLERIWSSVYFTGFLCIWKQGRRWC